MITKTQRLVNPDCNNNNPQYPVRQSYLLSIEWINE